MYENSTAWGELISRMIDLLRYVGWWCVGGFIAMGAACYGGLAAMEAFNAWERSGPSPRTPARRDPVRREARRGVREIEEFLRSESSGGQLTQ